MEQRLERYPPVGRGTSQHLDLLVGLGIVEHEAEHEAVLLRLGKWVGALLLDRVLGGKHEEGLVELVRVAADGHTVFLHRLEQRRLRLGGRAVDLVGEDKIGKERTLHEGERLAAVGRVLQDLRARDVARHQVGRELDPLGGEVEHPRQRAHHERLGQAGHAHHQAVAAGEDAHQDLLDDRLLADDHLADLGADAGHAGGKLFEPRGGDLERRRVLGGTIGDGGGGHRTGSLAAGGLRCGWFRVRFRGLGTAAVTSGRGQRSGRCWRRAWATPASRGAWAFRARPADHRTGWRSPPS